MNLPVKLKIAWIGRTKEPAIETLTAEYLKRISRYIAVEGVALRDEAALLGFAGRAASSRRSRMASGANSTLVLMDSQGKEFSSEQFASFIRDYEDRNPLPLVFAVGPADGLVKRQKLRRSTRSL